MYSYIVDENNIANVIDQNGNTIDSIGPWGSKDAAETWVAEQVKRANEIGVYPIPPND
jgi:GH35 family endo-1,4-beta-xylanase